MRICYRRRNQPTALSITPVPYSATVASPIDLLSASAQVPEARGRRLEWLPVEFSECLLVLSRRSKHPSVPRQPLALPAMMSSHTTTTTTITTHLSTDSTVVAAEAAANELLSVGEPPSTVVLHTAYARSAYSPYAGHAPLSRPASACPIWEAVG